MKLFYLVFCCLSLTLLQSCSSSKLLRSYSETLQTDEGVNVKVNLKVNSVKSLSTATMTAVPHSFSYSVTNLDNTKTFYGYTKEPKMKKAFLYIYFSLSDGTRTEYKTPMQNIASHSLNLEVSPQMTSPEIPIVVMIPKDRKVVGVTGFAIKYDDTTTKEQLGF